MARIEYFLMKDRTEEQIREKFGPVVMESVKHLKSIGLVTHKTENNETLYSINPFNRVLTRLHPDYWVYCLIERIRN